MKIAGIICEYNPIHNGHVRHMALTREQLGENTAIVCAMSGNFVQRGEPAVFGKHARAAAAVACGADLVVELPLTAVLSSAEGFARGGVRLLSALGVVTHLSFGSEAGELGPLSEAADCLLSERIGGCIGEALKTGISYASARQTAAALLLGQGADVLATPNNNLAVEYLKALKETGSAMTPITVRRTGDAHDSGGGESASGLRRMLKAGEEPWGLMTPAAADILKSEVLAGRGPVFAENLETAVLSRLRMLTDEAYQQLPDASEGLGGRLARYARTLPTVEEILAHTKTKRYAMSRLRRMLWCAVLGLGAGDMGAEPMAIRVLAMNEKGKGILREIKRQSALPVITKPAEAHALDGPAKAVFQREAAATDLYALGYPGVQNRAGGQEWTISPRVL